MDLCVSSALALALRSLHSTPHQNYGEGLVNHTLELLTQLLWSRAQNPFLAGSR